MFRDEQKAEEKTPSDLLCPISYDMLSDDVVISPSGRSFSRASLTTWWGHDVTRRTPEERKSPYIYIVIQSIVILHCRPMH